MWLREVIIIIIISSSSSSSISISIIIIIIVIIIIIIDSSCISCGKDTQIYHKPFPKPSIGVFTIAYLILSQFLTLLQWFPVFWSHQHLKEIYLPHKQMNKNLLILQFNRLLSSSFVKILRYLLIESAVKCRNI